MRATAYTWWYCTVVLACLVHKINNLLEMWCCGDAIRCRVNDVGNDIGLCGADAGCLWSHCFCLWSCKWETLLVERHKRKMGKKQTSLNLIHRIKNPLTRDKIYQLNGLCILGRLRQWGHITLIATIRGLDTGTVWSSGKLSSLIQNMPHETMESLYCIDWCANCQVAIDPSPFKKIFIW